MLAKLTPGVTISHPYERKFLDAKGPKGRSIIIIIMVLKQQIMMQILTLG
jgi:hypothetical protein